MTPASQGRSVEGRPHEAPGQIWYAAYGSSLDPARFDCYLHGGRPQGATRTYPGVRDRSSRVEAVALTLSGRVSFAWHSPTWGGAVAFYEPDDDGAAPDGVVLARAYLLTRGQLADVLEQEMWRQPGAEHDLGEVLGTGRQVVGPGRYETLHLAGELDGRPVVTLGTEDVAALGLDAPSAAYVATMARGLRATHALSDDEVVDYLLGCPGAALGWTPETLRTVLPAS